MYINTCYLITRQKMTYYCGFCSSQHQSNFYHAVHKEHKPMWLVGTCTHIGAAMVTSLYTSSNQHRVGIVTVRGHGINQYSWMLCNILQPLKSVFVILLKTTICFSRICCKSVSVITATLRAVLGVHACLCACMHA